LLCCSIEPPVSRACKFAKPLPDRAGLSKVKKRFQ
jgi:hypothetical protein